jgi:hypothetical protein
MRLKLEMAVLFKDDADTVKLSDYFATPSNDVLKLGKRGWPSPTDWSDLSVSTRDRRVTVLGECEIAATFEELMKPIVKGTELAVLNWQDGESGDCMVWLNGRLAPARKAFDRVAELELGGPRALLTLAVASGNADDVKVAIERGADPNASVFGKPAVFSYKLPVVRALLDAGADPKTKHGDATLLMAHACNAALVSRLLKGGADPNAQDSSASQDTALLVAIELADGKQTARSVQALLAAGADPNAGRRAPLHVAAELLSDATRYGNAEAAENQLAIIELLLSAKADRGSGELFYYAERASALQALLERLGKRGEKKAPVREGPFGYQLETALGERDWLLANELVDGAARSDMQDAMYKCLGAIGAWHEREPRDPSAGDAIEALLRKVGARRFEWHSQPGDAVLPASTGHLRAMREDVSVRAYFASVEEAERFAAYCRGERAARAALIADGWPDPDAWALDASVRDEHTVRAGAHLMPKSDIAALVERVTSASAVAFMIAHGPRGFVQADLYCAESREPRRATWFACDGRACDFEAAFVRALQLDPNLALSSALEHRRDDLVERAAARGALPLAPVDATFAIFDAIAPDAALKLLDNAEVDPVMTDYRGRSLFERWRDEPRVMERLRAMVRPVEPVVAPPARRGSRAPAREASAPRLLWQLDSKEWLSARKAAWEPIHDELETYFGKHGHLRKSDIAKLKAYFLRGEIDPEYSFKEDNGGPMPLLYRAWLHPDHSQETFEELARATDARGLYATSTRLSSMTRHFPASFDDIAPFFTSSSTFSRHVSARRGSLRRCISNASRTTRALRSSGTRRCSGSVTLSPAATRSVASCSGSSLR